MQELCRHANPNTTLGLYSQAFSEDARRAQSKVVEMVRNAPVPENMRGPGRGEMLNVPYCAPTESEISAELAERKW